MYICLKCNQFLKINAGNSLSELLNLGYRIGMQWPMGIELLLQLIVVIYATRFLCCQFGKWNSDLFIIFILCLHLCVFFILGMKCK